MKPQDVLALSVIVPPAPVVEAFARHASPIYDLVQALRQQSAILRLSRDLLLPRLMSGQLTLPEAEEAVASSL